MNSSRMMMCCCQAVWLLVLVVQCHSLPARTNSEESMLDQLQQAHSILGKLINQIQLGSTQSNTKKVQELVEAADETWDNKKADLEGLEEELERRNDGPEPRADDVELRMQEEAVLRRLSELLEKRRQALTARRAQQILSHAAHKRDHDIPFPLFGDY